MTQNPAAGGGKVPDLRSVLVGGSGARLEALVDSGKKVASQISTPGRRTAAPA